MFADSRSASHICRVFKSKWGRGGFPPSPPTADGATQRRSFNTRSLFLPLVHSWQTEHFCSKFHVFHRWFSLCCWTLRFYIPSCPPWASEHRQVRRNRHELWRHRWTLVLCAPAESSSHSCFYNRNMTIKHKVWNFVELWLDGCLHGRSNLKKWGVTVAAVFSLFLVLVAYCCFSTFIP